MGEGDFDGQSKYIILCDHVSPYLSFNRSQSYVLHQERQALFNPQTTTNPVGIGASVARSATRRTAAPKPIQPLVNLSTGGIFEPGSLLSMQQGSQQP